MARFLSEGNLIGEKMVVIIGHVRKTIRFAGFLAVCFVISIAFHQCSSEPGDLLTSGGSGSSFWQKTNGPARGFIRSLLITPDNHIFAGTDSSGVYRSSNRGLSWQQAGLDSLPIYSLALSPDQKVYAGSNNGMIYRSGDLGDSWTPISVSSSNPGIFEIEFGLQGQIFLGTNEGMFGSTDQGMTWEAVDFGVGSVQVATLLVSPEGVIYAGTEDHGILVSTDTAASWSQTNTGLASPTITSLARNSDGHIFAGTSDMGVFRSIDAGQHWTAVNTGLGNLQVLSIAINSMRHLFAGTRSGVFRSGSNGFQWAELNGNDQVKEVPALAFSSLEYIYLGTWGSGVYRSVYSTVTEP